MDEEGKQSSHKTPYTEFDQVRDDFILATSLQEQEGTLSTLATIESESETDEYVSDSSFDDDDDDADFSESQEFDAFLEGEGSNYDEDMEMEEDEIDPDELSYEELLELGEFIGEEKKGLSKNEICSFLYPNIYQSGASKSGIDKCVICQVEYEKGEALVALQCNHPYHKDCITKWLQVKKVCPICSNEVSAPKMVSNNNA
ncbi:hypothetical protein TanjilG_12093 [Lupinus angustifolius]|uniref:RING-type domain-containing protein n=1 Tax=Lupinus angustifolius TaxID=3871 RepID=A0A1J7HPB7_LUPAN|nr:PREDICTED: E3 ubiquitin ligase BIG BROTHER-related-like [Lupinus angustifolius]OIW14500.1 hypothetical protein TanjilG_12093 [Lupinus angustifolius]